jgi:hypothetical protein
MAAELPVVHLKIRHRVTGLTPPSVTTQDLLAQTLVRQRIQPRASGFAANHSQDAWGVCKDMGLIYSGNDTWDRMLQQGVQLLERFAQDGRVRIRRPRSTQQIQFDRTLGSGNNFVAYVDAIGELDGTPCVLERKTTSARYPEGPAGISATDPQLVCYSWMTGIDEVAQVVLVRKRLVEVQYLRATITEEQRQEFAALVDDTVRRIESGLFLPHSGVRFPPESLYHLPLPRALPRQARPGRGQPGAQTGSRPWSV